MPPTTIPKVDLSALNTLAVPATADYVIRIKKEAQIPEVVAFARQKKLPIFPLGGGSNIVLGQPNLSCVVLKIDIPGREITEQNHSYTEVTVGAGESWD